MVFSSIPFLFYFLPIILTIYYLAPRPGKNFVLFVTSLLFYAWGEPVYLFLMLFSILANYLFGLALGDAPGRGTRDKLWLAAACALNLALLGFFKYADFLTEAVGQATGFSAPALNLPLPLGISFYTFQAMSYLIDLYRGKVDAQRSLIAFGTYVALFPQLIAGPIVRFSTIAQELTCRRETAALFSQGALRFTAGLGKKVLLANGAGAIFEQVTASAQGAAPGFAALSGLSAFAGLSALSAWIGILAFTFQIYFDFSGYSDMAIGLGKMFGFHFPENFDYPYISKSITEFWRRWHMTLSSWFKEYVYIPLGGNKKGAAKQIRNIAVVWALTGIWHGASWNFPVWGLYFGVLLILEKLFLLNFLERLPAAIRRAYTMLFVVISWVLFSIIDLPSAASYLRAMFFLGGGPPADELGIYLLQSNGVFFILLLIGATPLPKKLFLRLADGPDGKNADRPLGLLLRSAGMAILFLLITAALVSSTYNPFLYFRF